MTRYDADNVIAPLTNSQAMRSQAALLVAGSTLQSQYLPSLFGGYGAGHWFTVAADFPENAGAIAYISWGHNGSAAFNRIATGSPTELCWPLPDGQERHYRVPPGQQLSTGVATLCSYDWLHYCGTATGMLRVYRSSLPSGQGTEQFRAP